MRGCPQLALRAGRRPPLSGVLRHGAPAWGSGEPAGMLELELVDDMAAFGWKQTNNVASIKTAQNATAIFLVINPLKPLKKLDASATL